MGCVPREAERLPRLPSFPPNTQQRRRGGSGLIFRVKPRRRPGSQSVKIAVWVTVERGDLRAVLIFLFAACGAAVMNRPESHDPSWLGAEVFWDLLTLQANPSFQLGCFSAIKQKPAALWVFISPYKQPLTANFRAECSLFAALFGFL